MSVVEFKLPDHPIKGEQNLVLEKPRDNSVWYLLTGENKSIPLPGLEREPREISEVIDAIKEQQGEDWLRDFVADGYSDVDVQQKKNKKTYQLGGLV